MKTAGIIINLDKDPTLEYSKKLIEYIYSKKCEIVVTRDIENMLFVPVDLKFVENTDEICKCVDFVIVLGGDGTILTVARTACLYNTPILGINLGTLGYLSDVEKNEAFNAVDKVLSGDFFIEKRMMLEAFLDGKENIGNSGLALNEVCIRNSVFSRMIRLEVSINNEFIDSFRADGLIVSTATGSTAYNLAAGGPILKPDTDLISITHLCPHTLYARPYVVSGNDIIKLKINKSDKNIVLFLDGHENLSLNSGSEVVVKRSRYYTNIIKTSSLSFYDILRRKMVEVRK